MNGDAWKEGHSQETTKQTEKRIKKQRNILKIKRERIDGGVGCAGSGRWKTGVC